MPVTFGQKAIWPRGLCVGIGLIAVLILVIAACISPLATRRFTQLSGSTVLATTTRVAPFRTCDNTFTVYATNADEFCGDTVDYTNVVPNDCKTYTHFIRSIQAFYLLTVLVVIAALVLAVLNAFGVVSSLFLSILIGLGIVFSLIGFAIGFAIYTKKFEDCFVESWKDRSDYTMGESAGLMLAAFLLLLCLLIASCVMEKGPHDGGQQQPQPKPAYVAPAPAPVRAKPAYVAPARVVAQGSDTFDL